MYILSKTYGSVLCICIFFETRCQNSIHIYLNTCGCQMFKSHSTFTTFQSLYISCCRCMESFEYTLRYSDTYSLHLLSVFWQLMSHDTLFNNNRIPEINLMNREMFKHCFNDQIRSRTIKLEFYRQTALVQLNYNSLFIAAYKINTRNLN